MEYPHNMLTQYVLNGISPQYPWLFNENYGYTYEFIVDRITDDIDLSLDILDQITENFPELIEEKVNVDLITKVSIEFSDQEKEDLILELLKGNRDVFEKVTRKFKLSE